MKSQPDSKIQIETKDSIGIIYLNSPSDRNILSKPMRNEILNALSIFEADKNINIIVIISKVDKVFCEGADIKELSVQNQVLLGII